MSTFKNYQEIFSNKEFRKYAFSAAAVQATMFGYFSISPVIYINLLDLSEEMFALLFSLNAVMFLVIAFSLAHFIAKIGVHKSIQIAGGLFLLAGCTMLLTYQLIGLKVITLFGPCLISSIGAAFALGASNNGAMKPFKEQSGKAAGLLGCIEFMIGGFVGSFVVSGMVSTTNPLACLLVGVGIFLILNMLLSKEISQSPSVQSINTQ